jgi:NADH-quinone oxidoreductase subunit N
VTAATMIVGTLVGVVQASVKRMLAYSSIAHGGYLLLAIVSANDEGKGAILFYLLTYAVTNLGAFGVIGVLESRDRANDRVRDYAGLWSREPALAGLMTIFLLSLGGFPPFGGFIAKWYVFTAAIEAGETTLAIIGVLTSVISVFFYLRVVVMMYMTPATGETAAVPPLPAIARAALVVAAILVLYLGVLPTQVLTWAGDSIRTIF